MKNGHKNRPPAPHPTLFPSHLKSAIEEVDFCSKLLMKVVEVMTEGSDATVLRDIVLNLDVKKKCCCFSNEIAVQLHWCVRGPSAEKSVTDSDSETKSNSRENGPLTGWCVAIPSRLHPFLCVDLVGFISGRSIGAKG